MADPTGRQILVSSLTSYHDYLSRAEVGTFCRRYAAILFPYKIDL